MPILNKSHFPFQLYVVYVLSLSQLTVSASGSGVYIYYTMLLSILRDYYSNIWILTYFLHYKTKRTSIMDWSSLFYIKKYCVSNLNVIHHSFFIFSYIYFIAKLNNLGILYCSCPDYLRWYTNYCRSIWNIF